MLLAGEAAGAGGSLVVRTLVPPPGSQPGDVLFLEGHAPTTDPAKQVGALVGRAPPVVLLLVLTLP